jgi:hypothetical protein
MPSVLRRSTISERAMLNDTALGVYTVLASKRGLTHQAAVQRLPGGECPPGWQPARGLCRAVRGRRRLRALDD